MRMFVYIICILYLASGPSLTLMNERVCFCVHMYENTNAHAHKHTRINKHTCTHTHTYIYTRTYLCIGTYTHTLPYIRICIYNIYIQSWYALSHAPRLKIPWVLALCCSALQCVAVCYRVLQYVAVCRVCIESPSWKCIMSHV